MPRRPQVPREPGGYLVQVMGMLAKGWMKRAACGPGDVNIFFPAGEAGGRETTKKINNSGYAPARSICGGCPVRAECLAAAMEIEGGSSTRYGMYGGAAPVERRRLRRSMKNREN